MRLNTNSKFAALSSKFIQLGLVKDADALRGSNSQKAIITFPTTPAVGSRYFFKSYPFAKNVTGLTVFSATQILKVFSESVTYDVVTADAYNNAVLTLVTLDGRKPTQLALNALVADNNFGKPLFFDAQVDWRQSFIEFTSIGAGVTTSQAFVFNIFYI
jgi:hypothetical protein